MKIFLIASLFSLSLLFSIDPSTIHFSDEYGRSIIFHGVNVVYKIHPFKPSTTTFDKYSFSDADIKQLKSHGINAVRLGLIWEGIETSPRVYDQSIMDVYKEIAIKLKENDIGIIIDLHQDLISRLFCGEGIPIFYAKQLKLNSSCYNTVTQAAMRALGLCHSFYDLGIEFDDYDIPTRESCQKQSFARLHTIAEFDSIYAQIYDNKFGLFDSLVSLWTFIIKNVDSWGIHDHLIGYDLWNEPFPRQILSDYKTLKPGYKDDRDYVEFYDKLYKRLSPLSNHFISLFQNSPLDAFNAYFKYMFGNYSKLPSGQENRDKQALNIHYYCFAASLSMLEEKEPTYEQATGLCREFYMERMSFDADRARQLGVPLIVSEFGACSHGKSCQEEIRTIVTEAEKNLSSWFYWNYKGYNDPTTTMGGDEEGLVDKDNIISEVKRKAAVRPYGMKYQGKPIISKYDEVKKKYITRYQFNPDVIAPTEIYASKTLTSLGDFKVTVKVQEGFKYEMAVHGDYVWVMVKGAKKSTVEVELQGNL